MSAKWSWSDDEVGLMLKTSGEFDRCLIGPGSAWGFRISELLSLTVGDVMHADGSLKSVVTVDSRRLKGGKPGKPWQPKPKPEGHAEDCPCNLCHQKAPRRRKPDDRSVAMGAAAPFIRARLDTLSKTRGGLYPDRYLFESRKRDAQGNSRPISRQQGWFRVKKCMQRAGIDTLHHATHSLRKTSARKFMELTGRIDLVRDWLGHRSSATTDAYLKSDNLQRLQLGAEMGEFLNKLAA